MNKNTTNQSSFKAGMYLLETLTSGMYNQPLSIFREYIQNAVDSIESSGPQIDKMKVCIDLDPFSKKIEISDDGAGISATIAEQVLSNIGISNKIEKNLRGFRGIGRLGGIAFSEKITFVTKCKDENIESIQEWDCKKLNEIISNKKNNPLSLRQLFNEATTFYQNRTNRKTESYFKVVMEGVSSFKNYLFDIEKIKSYLSEVAPLPFNKDIFLFSGDIDKFLSQSLSLYGKYKIFLNGEQLYKPYKDIIRVTKKDDDIIDRIDFFEIKIEDKILAYGWYGLRKDLLGAISKGEQSSGVRVRQGNILIGDSHLLDSCFRETRFNSYIIGEIHIDSNDLIPNSRRDDFVDNENKSLFYNEVERVLGVPLSKEIRMKSRVAASGKKAPVANTPSKKAPLCSAETIPSNVKSDNNEYTCKYMIDLFNNCMSCETFSSCDIGNSISKLMYKN